MLSILCVRLTIKVKVGIPESFKVGWYPPEKTGSSHLKCMPLRPVVNMLRTFFGVFFYFNYEEKKIKCTKLFYIC